MSEASADRAEPEERRRPHPLLSPPMADLQASISAHWDRRAELKPGDPEASADIHEAIGLLDQGLARVAEVDSGGDVIVH